MCGHTRAHTHTRTNTHAHHLVLSQQALNRCLNTISEVINEEESLFPTLQEVGLLPCTIVSNPNHNSDDPLLFSSPLPSPPLPSSPSPLPCKVFDAIPPEVGLDVDIKYALPCEDGSEHFPYLDRNKYADAILREIYQYGGDRKLVITCLDADLSIW